MEPPKDASEAPGSGPNSPDEESASSETSGMGGLGKHTLIYGFGAFLDRGIGFIMLPVYTRFLTPDDYGIISIIEITLDLITIVAGAQLVSGIFRYYHKATSKKEQDGVVSTALWGLMSSYALVGGFCFALASPLSTMLFDSPVHTNLIRIAAGSIIFQGLLLVPVTYARVRDRSLLLVTASVSKLLIGVTLNILFLVVMGLGAMAIFLSAFISQFIVGSVMAVWLVRQVGWGWAPSAVKDLLRYGIPMIGVQFATFVATFGDRFVLNETWGEGEVGLYSLAYRFGFLLVVVAYSPFQGVWGPRRFAVAKRTDRHTLLSRGFFYTNVLLVTGMVGLGLFSHDVIIIMTTPEFYAAAAIIPVVLIAYMFQCWAGVQDIGVLMKERTEYLTLGNWIAAGVAIVSYLLLIPPFGYWGAAIGTVLSFGTRWATTYYYSQKLWHVEYDWQPVLRLLTTATIITSVGIFLRPENLFLSIGWHLVLTGIYFALVWRSNLLTDGEKSAAIEWTRLLARRLRGLFGGGESSTAGAG